MLYSKFVLLFILIFTLTLNAKPIKIGTSVALTGPSQALGNNLVAGMKFAFDDINNQGGIHGSPIQFIVLDDQYNPDKTVRNTMSLINDYKVDILTSFTGTPTVQRILPLLIKYDKTLFFPFTGSQIFITPPYNDYVKLLRPTYWQELETIISYLRSNQYYKVAIFYQLDGYGMNGVSGIRHILSNFNLKPIAEINYKRGKLFSESFSQEANLLLKSKPDAIICIASYEASAGIIRDIRAMQSDIMIANISFSDKDSLKSLLIQNAPNSFSNLLHTQVVPEFLDFPILQQYLKETNRYNSVEFEGYLNAITLIHILKNTPVKNSIDLQKTFDNLIHSNLAFTDSFHNQIYNTTYLIKSKNNDWIPIK